MDGVAKRIVDILIQNEGRDKKILFLPYKIEMWDSLESVFKECVRRRLMVAIQPLSYMYLEHHKIVASKMDEWDNDVKKYVADIDTFRPDIVFIHYPFDSNNTITTIPEKFYSVNLKRRGIKIAYISYHGNSALDHEMLLPAVTRADYIFAYDESERQRYYEVWAEKKIRSNAKIFATGTPKLDAYIKAYRISQKNDAQAILITNSLMPFINDVDRINKYKAIIEKEQTNGVIIYRQHPLLLETLKRTNLWRYDDYKRFLEYLRTNNIIIDDNYYIKDTLRHCKKLYCDWASILILCRDANIFEVEAII